jgi:hypothetical protein
VTKPTRRLAAPSGPALGAGNGPEASTSSATLHSLTTSPADVDRLLDAVWTDLARVIAASRARAAGSKGS